MDAVSNYRSEIGKLEREVKAFNDVCIKITAELEKLTQIKSGTGAIYLKKKWASICGKPLGVLKLVSNNVPAEPPFYFFDEYEITFGKAEKCNIVIGSDECSNLHATVSGHTTWSIKNHNGKHLLYVNGKYCEKYEKINVKSGDKIQFGGNEKLNVIYEFRLYSNEAFSNKLEAQSFFETQLRKYQQKADKINLVCSQLKTKLDILKETKNTTEVKKEGEPSESKKIKIEPEESKNILDKTINYVNCETSKVKLETELTIVDKEFESKLPLVDAKVVKIKREP